MHTLPVDHPIGCRCGRLRGTLAAGARVARIACYCLDCQTSAHALGQSRVVLDALGGTDVITSLQQHLSFSGDASTLACLSLSEDGILRWYAGCCATPIANTTRNPVISYVGIVHACVAATRDELAPIFGPAGMAVYTGHARRRLKSARLRTAANMAEGIAQVVRARIDGTWRTSPFFDPVDHQPVIERRVLSPAEWRAARRAVERSGAR